MSCYYIVSFPVMHFEALIGLEWIESWCYENFVYAFFVPLSFHFYETIKMMVAFCISVHVQGFLKV